MSGFIPKDWNDGPEGGTVLSADDLDHLGKQYAAMVADLADPTSPVGAALAALGFARVAAPNRFTQTQTFDPIAGIAIGDKLKLTFTDGFYGQRLNLTGLPQSAGMPDVMPYFEVAPTTTIGTDTGGAVAGMQIYGTPGGGGVPDREFLAIEAAGDRAVERGFKISPWRSGTGVFRPVMFWDGVREVFRIEPAAGGVGILSISRQGRLNFANLDTVTPILMRKDNAGFATVQSRVYSNTTGHRSYVFLSHNSGTFDAPGTVGNNYLLGDVVFGGMNGSTEVPSAFVRATSKQSWVFGTAQGSKVGINTTPSNSATSQTQIELDEPTANDETGVLIRTDRAGARSLSRVSVGAPDSAGVGFRVLKVAN